MNRIGVLLLLALLALGAQDAVAIGRVYARLPNSTTSPIYNLRIKTMHATVAIYDQLAITHVDQEFTNDTYLRLEGFYVFTLPEGAQVHEMYLWINGQRVPYVVKKREEAVVKYQEIVSRIADPAILEQLGSNLFKLRIFPFEARGSRRIEIQYSQPLAYERGSIRYVFPLDMTDYTSAAIEQTSIVVDLQSQLPITSVSTSADQSPTAVVTTKLSDKRYKIEYGLENVTFARDFSVRCNVERGGLKMLARTWRDTSTTAAPYFILWSAVPDTLYSDSITTRELTFVADVSSSMEGVRVEQVKEALQSFVDFMNEKDRFNIIAFSTGALRFRPNLVSATAAAKDSARAFIAQLTALGLTNFEEALRQSLAQSFSDSIHSAVVFLTDGLPSWGQTNPDSLLALAARLNVSHTHIYPVGIGEEHDYTLLTNLGKRSGGFLTKITFDDSIHAEMKDLYRLLFLPKLRYVSFDYGAIGAYDVHPSPFPDVYAGDQILTTGRFATGGTANVRMTGTAGGTPRAFEEQVVFADTDHALRAVSRYWGARKIESILELIGQMGELKELVDQVIALSITYSVLTPYTAFLVVEPSTGSSTDVEVPAGGPVAFSLEQNYPNPFNPSTTIRYTISGSTRAYVTLSIYDMLGRRIKTLVADWKSGGIYVAVWDGTDDQGKPVASGSYVYRLTSGGNIASRMMILTR
jgi:Ca-activated chloride channel family protein